MFILVNWTQHTAVELATTDVVDTYGKGHEDGIRGDDVTVFEDVPGEGLLQRYPTPEPETEPEPVKAPASALGA
jgi:hypothetical protein